MAKRVLFLLPALSLLICLSSAAQTPWEAQVDSILNNQFKKDGTGAAAIITQGGKTLYHKGFGLADLENKVPMRPEMVFRLGSITKQITAVAILKLMEEGKLNLQDPLTKYIPDYPAPGDKVTIEHLLTHTSGIPSYTDMPVFDGAFMRKDMSPEELINVFKKEPFDFEPGTKWNYNNSGYVLLGYIIEKVSGKSYGDFIEQEIFKPLGMKNSLYGSNTRIIANKAQGYGAGDKGYQHDAYLSMTLPYSAGSLMGTVEDLAIWNKSIHEGKLVKKETLQKAFVDYRLLNGRQTHYGFGWGIGEMNNEVVYEHSGGINGYLTNALYIPSKDLFIAVFSNCTCEAPIETSEYMATMVLGTYKKRKAIRLDSASLQAYTGVFEDQIEEGQLREITRVGNQLYSQRKGSTKFKVFAFEKDKFFFEDSPTEIYFVRDQKGNVTGLKVKTLAGQPSLWVRTTKPFTPQRKEVTLTEDQLKKWVGNYRIAPTFSIAITYEGGMLKTQATNQPKFDIYPESEKKFFLKVVDAQLEFFTDETGKVTHLMLYQGGNQLKGVKEN